MKIKQKLFLGLGALFVLILFLGILSGYYVTKLSGDTKNILAANYNSVKYSREMLIALDEIATDSTAFNRFDKSLGQQKLNCTEVGEQAVTDRLSTDFELLRNNYSDSNIYTQIRKDLVHVMQLNMDAIQRKSDLATHSASDALMWISVAGTLSFIIALTLLFNFPGSIANPIKELTASIKNIAAKNYSERVHFDRKDEYGEMAAAFNTMAEKLEEYNSSNIAKLTTEKKRIETLINNIHEPVIGLDENKNILFINEEALNITNTKSKEIIGKPIQDIAVNNDLIRMLIKDFFDSKKNTEPIKIYADNKESYFQKEIIPIDIIPTGEEMPQHIGDVIFLKNITAYKELDFAKTNFIATVSHELKTPMSSIKMSTQLLKNDQIGNLNAEQKNLVDSIKDDANRLLKITSELLNMTQLENGKIQLQVTAAAPQDLVQKAIDNNITAAENKSIQIKTELSENLPLINVDADKTIWIISNLLSNAVRYSYEFATVFVKIFRENDFIKIAVTDTGQGIAPQYLEKIFDRYFRVPGTKREGSGLGLAISKELIEQQGGSICVKSELGTGSVFEIALPVS